MPLTIHVSAALSGARRRPLSSLGRTLLAFALCTSAATLSAQSGDITLATKATPDQIHIWLTSGNPRLVSWAAHFAREQNDRAALAMMVQLIARWTPPQGPQDDAGRAQIPPMTAMLDALIQRDTAVPPDTLAAIAPDFPIQAAILATRLPIAEATPLLLTWYAQRTGSDRDRLARIASMALAHAPPPGFAASILAETEEALYLSAVSPHGGFGRGGSVGSCGDGVGSGPHPDWPPIFHYAIEENSRQPSDPVLVEAAGDRITYLRHERSGGWGSCSYPGTLDNDSRHHLLAQMLGVQDKEVPWKANTGISIVWESNDQFLREAQRDVASEEAKLQATVASLQSKNFLTPEEAASVRPRLAITVADQRQIPGAPLPPLRFTDPRTVLTPPSR